ncbi:MAG: hypothetical protein LBI41_03180 [Lactobacillales bacterium]|jgi:hypothetical protein|nr:hypothetical protein [Lactobacillales bacterium]
MVVHRNLRGIFINCAPKNFEEPHQAWHLAANYIEHIEEILEDFKSNTREQLLDNYNIINTWQNEIQKEIEAL